MCPLVCVSAGSFRLHSSLLTHNPALSAEHKPQQRPVLLLFLWQELTLNTPDAALPSPHTHTHTHTHTQSCFICWAQATTTACSPALPLTGAHAQHTWCCTHAYITSPHTQRKRICTISAGCPQMTWDLTSFRHTLTYTDTYSQKNTNVCCLQDMSGLSYLQG